MDNLISRSALLQEFETEHIAHNSDLWHITEIKAFIENQPTAYDVEKVVAELGENIECSTEVKDSMCQKYADCFRCLTDRAIEIVRKGGI